jgi:hypothetical protein
MTTGRLVPAANNRGFMTAMAGRAEYVMNDARKAGLADITEKAI